ncbi:PH domain-containing protein [Paenarthrobacter sp. Z7-10]|uniref:hypothetical protein n=1 Tax=Paenarthrobacter sp. Z7-10 TaxID=2787635 RepID=UPI0022A925ED|nr:hypothetical protein [Paenarthrobacter sp. Z7-10]MCZ2404323.1 PH domain-containing protein [Paenarthrobacter sp. Z7-10]
MKTSEPIALRSTLSRWSSVLVWVICMLLAINFLWLGKVLELLAYLPWLAVACWGMYTLCWHPVLRVEADRLVMVNLLRDRLIPFSAVADIRVTHSVLIKTADATYTSWGAPGLERFGPKLGDGGVSAVTAGGRRPQAVSRTGSQAILQRAWSSWEQLHEVDPQPGWDSSAVSVPTAAVSTLSVSTRWNRTVLIGWAVIVAACVLDIVLNL